MPSTEPLSLRRGGKAQGQPPAAPASTPEPSPPGPEPASSAGEGETPADDVYGFLVNFSAGVQRGLDEARRTTDEPDDSS
jgi:hypothetical protein